MTAVTLAFAGDVMLGRLVNRVLNFDGYRYVWGNTLDTLRRADIRIINLECVISDKGSKWTATPKVFYFRADPDAAFTLQTANIDFASNANNHSLDFQEEALLDMLNRLNQNGIAHVGAGQNLAAASKPAIMRKRDTKIGVAAFADHPPEWAATETKPGINYMPVDAGEQALKSVEQSVMSMRVAGADYVILSMHWGPNMREFPTEEFQMFARAVTDIGVDVFFGHSAHIFQGVEVHNGRLILYDTGDFVDDYAVDPDLRNDQSFLYLVTFEGGRI
ncbi:MAG: CapA family protein [Thaumarchaeota archaeon]|nr:CapA family protein [Nitrososphaerota archaeon]MCL5318992.1 CapA family protein [Nitrososphaerota archaeon]